MHFSKNPVRSSTVYFFLSLSGRWLSLSGTRGITCVELPRRSGKQGRFAQGSEHVTCKSSGIAERFFICQSKLQVQEVQWHPGSAYDSHLVVLASDNYLRIYNVDLDSQTPEQAISLSARPRSSTFFGSASLSVQGSLGETAVSFTFAPAVSGSGEDEREEDCHLFPMFILHGNGNVYSLVTSLGEQRTTSESRRVQGKNCWLHVGQILLHLTSIFRFDQF